MKKNMIVMLSLTSLLFGGIFAFGAFKSFMIRRHINGNSVPPITVSAMRVDSQPWQPSLSAVGSLYAVNDVDVTTEVAGLVKNILFTSGQEIQEGEIMVELNADSEIAQLKSLEAAAELAQVTYKRDKEQYAIQGISKAVLDMDIADLKSKKAQVEQQAAIVAKKTIRSPFTGKLGISEVNLGQYLNPGDKIVPLQSLDPIYVDFYLPQQNIPQIHKGQSVIVTMDPYPHESFEGEITSINPKVDSSTRNILIEATLPNPGHKLVPGMYAEINIKTGSPRDFPTIPQTAISYNPYGDLIYVLEEKGKDKEGALLFIAKQRFVNLGETRGDQVQILKGLEKGDFIVSAGQLKLKNGSPVIINNAVVPPNNPTPDPKNEQG